MRKLSLVLLVLAPAVALADADGDGVDAPADCDDNDAGRSPNRPELCDGIDNNCNAQIDEGIPTDTIWYKDEDHDGFGRVSFLDAAQGACAPGLDYASWSPIHTDCDDQDATVHPLVTEADWAHPPLWLAPVEVSEASRDPSFVGDGIDQDCDLVDLCFLDADDDDHGAAPSGGAPAVTVSDTNLNCADASAPHTSSVQDDCDDANPDVYPGAADAPGDSVDQDCDGLDAAGTSDTDAVTLGAQDTDGANDTDTAAKAAGCACDSSNGSPLWLGVGLAVLARRRRAAT